MTALRGLAPGECGDRDRHRPDDHAERAQLAEGEDRDSQEPHDETDSDDSPRRQAPPHPAGQALAAGEQRTDEQEHREGHRTDERIGHAEQVALPYVQGVAARDERVDVARQIRQRLPDESQLTGHKLPAGRDPDEGADNEQPGVASSRTGGDRPGGPTSLVGRRVLHGPAGPGRVVNRPPPTGSVGEVGVEFIDAHGVDLRLGGHARHRYLLVVRVVSAGYRVRRERSCLIVPHRPLRWSSPPPHRDPGRAPASTRPR